MQNVETLEQAAQPSELPRARAADALAGAGTRDAAVGTTYRVRAVFFLQPIALVLVRLLHDADDLAGWDLTGFLNANSFSTLRQLLARPEVHFWNPFSFPQYNTGAESVITAILARILSPVSLYWTPVVILLVYDALFLLLLHLLFKRLYRDTPGENIAWILLAMSPVILTFMSTTAFDMEAFGVILLGIVGSEYFLQRRSVVGSILLAGAFCAISQAYPLAFYLPYFVAVWCVYRTIGQPVAGISFPRRTLRAAAQLLVLAGFVYLANWASNGVYLSKIAPEDPYASGASGLAAARLAENMRSFLHQSFLPVVRPDEVPVGFAPYFLYVVLIVAAVVALMALVRRRGLPRPRGSLGRALIGACFSLGLIGFGYLPAFISGVLKSQRGFFGDLFLLIVLVFWLLRLLENGWIKRTALWSTLAVLLCASNAYYLYFTLSVDHSRSHYPRFDFDLSDGVVRHDLITAIEAMKRAVEQEHAVLVVYYPNSEDTTDPPMFFSRFLRHFGPYKDRPDVIVPCRWCEYYPGSGIRYGCPFPEVVNQSCGLKCCHVDPLEEITRRGLTDRTLVLWWHVTPERPDAVVPGATLESIVEKFAKRYRVSSTATPATVTGWRAFEMLPLPAD